MLSLVFKLLGDASPLRRTLAGLRTEGKAAGTAMATGMNSGLGGNLRALLGGGRGAVVGGTLAAGTALAVGMRSARARSQEALGIANLASSTGMTAEEVQKAKIAEERYGEAVKASSDSLRKAMALIDDSEVMRNSEVEAMAKSEREWEKAINQIQNDLTPTLVTLSNVFSSLSASAAKATGVVKDTLAGIFAPLMGGGKPQMGASGSWVDVVKTTKAALPNIKSPTADAMQRIGLFVGGAPSAHTIKIHLDQLAMLRSINSGIKQTNSLLR